MQKLNVTLGAEQILRDFAMDCYNLKTDEIVFFAIRGVTIDNNKFNWNDNQLDFWNDTVAILDKNYFLALHGTVDASEYWVKNPMVPAGAAQVLTGLTSLELGSHRGRLAFVQRGEVLVLRDSNKDGNWQETQIYKGTGINVHPAYTLSTKNIYEIIGETQVTRKVGTIGKNGAACTVAEILWASQIWKQDFIERAVNSKQKTFYRLYLDGRELSLYIAEKYNNRTEKNFSKILYDARQKNQLKVKK